MAQAVERRRLEANRVVPAQAGTQNPWYQLLKQGNDHTAQ